MPPIETDLRNQWCVLWPLEGHDSYSEPLLGEPVELRVRWEDRPRDITSPQSVALEYDATIVINRRIEVGSQMWLGTLDDWYGEGSAGKDVGLVEVVEYTETPDLKNRHTRRVVYVRRYRDTLGESA